MHSETRPFIDFLDKLKAQGIIDDHDITEAFKYLGGIRGIIDDSFYMFGYEKIAREINAKYSVAELIRIFEPYKGFLGERSEHRYEFSKALTEKKSITESERRELILAMPEKDQKFLLRYFFGPSL